MSGKSIKTLADQLWKSHGVSLITTFDSGIVPGWVLERRSWNDISRVGHLKDGVKAADLPDVEGPVPCMLADFRRSHEMKIAAALRLLQPTDAGAESQFKRASEAVATFDAPVIYSMSLLAIEDAPPARVHLPRCGWQGTRPQGGAGPPRRPGPRRAVALAQRGNDRVEAGAGVVEPGKYNNGKKWFESAR